MPPRPSTATHQQNRPSRPHRRPPSRRPPARLAVSLAAALLRGSGRGLLAPPSCCRALAPSTPRRPPSSTAAHMSSGADAASAAPPLAGLLSRLDNSWPDRLSPNLEVGDPARDVRARPVKYGHFVAVDPKALRAPRLVLHSPSTAADLGLAPGDVASDEFLRFFSGDTAASPAPVRSWATPYALSIMGTPYTSNCPFGTGEGYGDGRALSVGEAVHDGQRLEMQLKGAGPTPFCRGADGRAVLRSSIREYLASEAMHHLGIATTRALSLIVSGEDTSQRPWYGASDHATPKDTNDILGKLRAGAARKRRGSGKADPDTMITEPNAITTRVAPSFVRVGHLDLFARRLPKIVDATTGRYDAADRIWTEYEAMVWHAVYREHHDAGYAPHFPTGDVRAAAKVLLTGAADGMAAMVAGWVRVGYVQGNFNGDNCLVAGRTMDYGPFGWVEEYDPVYAKWTGSGEHFGFMNQPTAGLTNFMVLVKAVMPVFVQHGTEAEVQEYYKEITEYGRTAFQTALWEMFSVKLGLAADDRAGQQLWQDLEPLLTKSRADWTIFWRELSYVAQQYHGTASPPLDDMVAALEGGKGKEGAFYTPLTPVMRKDLTQWMARWADALAAAPDPGTAMLAANPKYVLREWMLVEAYASVATSEAPLRALAALVEDPYGEGDADAHRRFYRRASAEAAGAGGTAFMS